MQLIRKICKILAGGVLILLLFTFLAVGFVWMNQFRLEICLNGQQTITLEYGETYEEPGAEVYIRGNYTFRDGIRLDNVQIITEGEVVSEQLGIYCVAYRTSFLSLQDNASRTVCIIDTRSPEIQLIPDSDRPVEPGEHYEDPGFRAVDNYDGDITEKVVRKEVAGGITYAVIDSSGNPAYAVRKIPEYDPIPPEIQLEGERYETITVGTKFEEPGYKALDNVDGELTEYVIVNGNVDWLIPGVYDIQYTVTDSAQNEVTISRTVEVQAKQWCDTVWPEGKTIYLTFDDGPGPYTMKLLDLLDQYGVKATFFVVDSGYDSVMQEIVKRGHSIGIHSVSHDYSEIYASPESYFSDLYRMQQIIYDNTGVLTTLMRFPGGGSNLVIKNSYKGLMSTLTWAVQDAGFQYFDWNVDSDDAGNAQKSEQVRDNVIKGIQENDISMVLQHDIHLYSVNAVESIIEWGLEHGYQFLAVRDSTPGFHHDVVN